MLAAIGKICFHFDMEAALERAKRQAGGRIALGVALGISPQAISQWKRCPAERALDVEKASGVSRHDLRPDIYGPAPSEVAA